MALRIKWPVDPVLDRIVATVAWSAKGLLGIVLVRRSDSAMGHLPVPEDLRDDLRAFDREAVLHHGQDLRQAVAWALPEARFELDAVGPYCLRDGATPAELGTLRRFDLKAVGVDIGEFDIPDPRCFH